MMYQKKIDASNSLVAGILLIFIGMMICVYHVGLLKALIYLFATVMIVHSVSKFLQLLTNQKKDLEQKINYGNVIGNGLLGVGLLFFPNLPMAMVTLLFSFYILFNALVKLVDYFCLKNSQTEGRIVVLLQSIFYFLFGITLLFSPQLHAKFVLILIGIYIILLGITRLQSFFKIVLPERYKNRLKRKVHISLPVFLVAFIPQKMLHYINGKIKPREQLDHKIYEKRKENKMPDMEVFVHVMKDGAGSMGHVDLSFDGELICYGNYDEESSRLFSAIGDGVLFITKKEPYIEFLLSENKETIFSFGLSLTENQKENVRKEIKKLKENLVVWNVKSKDSNAWIYKLIKKTNPKLYKFKKGKFKTYFVLTTNCVLLADTIIGASGSDIIKLNGIITPGTYYDYLQSEFLREHSMVMAMDIYNPKNELL